MNTPLPSPSTSAPEQERSDLLANAPHLAHALPILMPCYKWWEVPFYWAGLKMYDIVAGGRQVVGGGVPSWCAGAFLLGRGRVAWLQLA